MENSPVHSPVNVILSSPLWYDLAKNNGRISQYFKLHEVLIPESGKDVFITPSPIWAWLIVNVTSTS